MATPPPSFTSPIKTTTTTPTPHFLTNSFSLLFHPSKPHCSFIPKATSQPEPDPDSESDPQSDDDPIDSRIAQMRLKYRSGTGKKAELRKTKKGTQNPGSGSGGPGVFLPPVQLKEPVSDGLKVEFGFSPFSERVNGRLAGMGLVALLVVELATGKSVISYHTPSIVFIQVYFMAAVSALYLKFEKEKVSVWP